MTFLSDVRDKLRKLGRDVTDGPRHRDRASDGRSSAPSTARSNPRRPRGPMARLVSLASRGGRDEKRHDESPEVLAPPPRPDQSVEEMRRLTERIGDHLGAHVRRSDEMLGVMQSVTPALAPLPSISRNQEHLLESVQSYMARLEQRDEEVQTALLRLADTTSRQQVVLESIQGHLESNSASTERLGESVDGLERSLTQFTERGDAQHETMVQFAAESRSRESEFMLVMRRSQQWITTAVICCCMAAIVAMATAVIAVAI